MTEAAQSSLAASEREWKTFRWDLVRGGAYGVVEMGFQVFALLILIRVFEADDSIKRYLPAAHGIGLLLCPFFLGRLAGSGRVRPTTVVSLLWTGAAISVLMAAVSRSGLLVLAGFALAQILVGLGVPLMTRIYSDNYPAIRRGQRVSTAIFCSAILGILFGFVGGGILDIDPEHLRFYPLLFVLVAAALVLGAMSIYRIPSDSVASIQSPSVWLYLKEAWEDRVFRLLLVGWMFMGFGNLMLIPVRVEYLANSRYGVTASNAQIALVMAVTVPAFRILSVPIWGKVFDLLNLIVVRVILNITFMVSIVIFFTTHSLWVMGVGAAMLGVAFGGGALIWSLWVTKIAPPEKVSHYMSVHGMLTGVRATTAPFLGYYLLERGGPLFVASISVVMIVISCFLFLPLYGPVERARASGL